eukprot:gene21917-151_t
MAKAVKAGATFTESSECNVIVTVRVRPLSAKERKEQSKCIISMEGQSTTIAHPQGKIQPLDFTFDHSFWSCNLDDDNFKSQVDVFKEIGTMLLKNTFEGYNSCLFAYGQTGSGKTYTMMGYGEDKGVIPLLCERLFEEANARVEALPGRWNFSVEVSYLEIYCEKCKCLLNPQPQTMAAVAQEYKVREHPVTGPYVENLTKIIVHDFKQIEKLMTEGNKTRTVAATKMNETSSRSHAIFALIFTQTTTDEHDIEHEMVSKINLVDLAGSERSDRTGATGQTLKEGSNINQSLTTLGKVIHALASAGKKGAHVPFRDSALTWLLKENLSGNSKTVMIAALSPAASNYD